MLVKVFNFVSHKVVKGWESQATYYYVWGGLEGVPCSLVLALVSIHLLY